MSAYQKLIIKRCPQLHLLQLEGKGKGGGGGRGQNVRGTDANARSYQGQPQQPDAGIDRILEFLESLDPPVCDQASPVHELHRSISQLGINIIWIHKR
uniref:Uncharacterized protein n=1 Tax=Solanum tuberosum TaxID=4113 RepID=M1AUZ7_SOLTU